MRVYSSAAIRQRRGVRPDVKLSRQVHKKQFQVQRKFLEADNVCHASNRTVFCVQQDFGWRRGEVVSGVRRMNEVNARRARLVHGWVTVFGRVYHLGM